MKQNRFQRIQKVAGLLCRECFGNRGQDNTDMICPLYGQNRVSSMSLRPPIGGSPGYEFVSRVSASSGRYGGYSQPVRQK